MKRTMALLALLLAFLAGGPLGGAAMAQAPQWQERQTKYIAVLYPAGSEAEANRYAEFVDAMYEEVTAQLGYRPDPPLTLRIYPTLDIYRQVNPLARKIEGIVAHAHTGRREISIAVPLTAGLDEVEIRNNVRHELTHIIAAELSDGRLSVMWQEGIAQYVEQPAPQLELKVGLLRQAVENRAVLPWRDLDAAGVMYDNPSLGYPESWSIVSFLIQRDGLPPFVDFVRSMAAAAGYRSALEQAYGTSADTLEAEWRNQIAAWIDGGWKEPPAAALDIGSIQAAIDAGRYAEALAGAENALAREPSPALETLRDLAKSGVAADEASAAARAALVSGDYAEAAAAVERARPLYARLSRGDTVALLDEYAARAAEGQRAYGLLDNARRDMGGLRIGSARSNLDQAALLFAQLGDGRGRGAAQQLHATLNQRIRLAGLVLLALVMLGLAWNIDRRRAARKRALPFG